ncbi:MAG: S41 family peptidase [Planctomycetota bacterium]|jgi:carboxyl-terminal processing protease
MPKRNIVWIVIGVVIAVLLWKLPETVLKRDKLYNQFGPLVDVQLQILKNYVEPVDEQDLLEGAIEGMLNPLDPYCKYFDPNEYAQFHKRTEGQYSGIGVEVTVTQRGEFVVISPIEGSPAFRAEMLTDDRIMAIDGRTTVEMTLLEGVELITGEPGTKVTLTIYRPSTDETFTKTITRQIIKMPTIRGWARSEEWEWDYVIDPEYGIGYVRISSFDKVTTDQLDEVMIELLTKKRIRALVLDVRDNPGGLLPVVVNITNRFLSEGLIVSTKGRTTTEELYMAVYEHTYPSIRLAVLVNRGSASASEILAGALKDHNRAILVGEKTFGKGSVQEVFKISNRDGSISMLKLTAAYYYLPNGKKIDGRGVEPHKVVELTNEELMELNKSRLAVYSTSQKPSTTQAATTTAPVGKQVEIVIDRQLQTALDVLREEVSTQPSKD